MKKRISQLEEKLRLSYSGKERVSNELNGFTNELPEHRVLFGQLVAKGKYKNGQQFDNLTLAVPQKDPEKLHFNNFRKLSIYTGVSELSSQIDNILSRQVSDVELEILNDIFKQELIINSAHIMVTESDILKMLDEIESQLY